MKKISFLLLLLFSLVLFSCDLENTESYAEVDILVSKGVHYVYYGSYPQSHVSDESLINELNSLTNPDKNGYYQYKGNQYVKIINERDTVYIEDYNFSSGAPSIKGEEVWFIVEPIKWRILLDEEEHVILISDLILDCSAFYEHLSHENRIIDDKIVYANNYKYSTLRSFLNDEFLNAAFTFNEQRNIIISEVDNSFAQTKFDVSGVAGDYSCENTMDKIYTLSYAEVVKYGLRNDGVIAKVSDYSIAKGVLFNNIGIGCWRLRSPSTKGSSYVITVQQSGSMPDFYSCYTTCYGVRPVISLRVKKN